MKISEYAEYYCAKNEVARTIVFNSNRFAKLIRDCEISELCREDLDRFIAVAGSLGFTKSSIHGTIGSLRTLARDAKVEIEFPTVAKSKKPLNPPTIETIDAVWPHLELWAKQHVVVSWYTAARLADVISMQIAGFDQMANALRWTAAKTKIQHIAPLPDWVRQWLTPVKLPFQFSNDWAQVIVRDELAKACNLAGFSPILPREIRQAGYEAWAAVDGMACKVLHDGKMEGVMSHYVSPMSILQSAVNRLRPPSQMRGEIQATAEQQLLDSFRRLDSEGQVILTSLADKISR